MFWMIHKYSLDREIALVHVMLSGSTGRQRRQKELWYFQKYQSSR